MYSNSHSLTPVAVLYLQPFNFGQRLSFDVDAVLPKKRSLEEW